MEELYNIPSSWMWSTIEGIGITYSGGTPKTSDESNFDGDIPWITPADLTGYKAQYISRGRRTLSDKGLSSCSAKLMPQNTVLFSSRAPIGYVAIASNPVSTNQGFKSISPYRGIDSRYVYFYLKSAKDLAESRASGTTFKELSGSRFNQLPIPIAPCSEQVRIVDRIEQLFSDMDKGEELLKTVQKQLATYRQSVLKAAVTGELTKDWREKNKKNLESGEKLLARILESRRKNWRGKGKYKEPSFLDVSSLPELPPGWVWSNFDQISNVITKGSSPNWQGFEYTDQGIVFVRSQNVDWGFLALDEKVFLPPAFNEKEKKSVIKSGDVLLNIVGASIGRTAVADERIDGANCNQAVAIIRLSEEISPYYACKYLLSSFAQNIIHSKKVDVARANFNLNQIAELAVALPGRDEQEEIIQRIDKVFSQIDTFEALCEAELKRSTTLRQAILKSAFSGKLVAQDPADEPASELLARIKSGDSPKAKTKTAAPRRGRKPRSGESEAV